MSAAAFGLALALVLTGCSGGGSDSDSGGSMFIESCNLGCNNGQSGVEISCGLGSVTIAVNGDIYVDFSEPVDPDSVTSETFIVQDQTSSATPPGSLFVSPANPKRVVFRPAINFVNGSPVFGFNPNSVYRVLIPGESSSDFGPFIQSIHGRSNRTRMRCSVEPEGPIADAVPGDPTVDIFVTTLDFSTPGIPDDVLVDQNADGAVGVVAESTIKFIFNDVMNPSTLLDEGTGQPPFLAITFDVDGDLATSADQVPIFGTYDLQAPDQTLLQTVLTFTPSNGIPSGGGGIDPRLVVISLPSGIKDLADNSISGSSLITFAPERVVFDPVTLPDVDGENFTDTENLNAPNSGAAWGNGRLQRGSGGGSGRLGALRIGTGQAVTLNTDGQVFPLPNVPNDLMVDVAPGVEPAITVTDGIFEFSSIVIEQGGRLVFEGTQPARVFARGEVSIQNLGEVDLSGGTPAVQLSDALTSNAPGEGGPNAGDGGAGGDRPDNTGNDTLLQLPTPPAVPNPGAVTDGERGGPVGRDPALAASGGSGGAKFPSVFPTTTDTVPPGVGTLKFTFIEAENICVSQQVASGGAGGAYAQDGRAAFPVSPALLAEDGSSNLPLPPAQGGVAAVVGIEAPDPESAHNVRKLRSEFGHLRGGSGGGGGGAHLFGTQTNASAIPCAGDFTQLTAYFDHSAASGGGGGGALQLVAGTSIELAGKILAHGGDGGSAFETGIIDQRQTRSSPGGGGSGGAVRLQAASLFIDSNNGDPGRIDVRGGFGGTSNLGGIGGRGGHGLVRLEDLTGNLTRPDVSPKILPFTGQVNPTTGLVESQNVVSTGAWAPSRFRPETFSGSVSCWMTPQVPEGSFLRLLFTEDDVANEVYGWNMDVVYDAGQGEVLLSYRSPDPESPYAPTLLEDVPGLQNGLNYPLAPGCTGDYFAVRFQGAQSVGDIAADPCDISASEIVAGSLTPWVSHPAELNAFSPAPNMIRFVVVFDSRMVLCGAPATFVKGVTNLKIEVTPD